MTRPTKRIFVVGCGLGQFGVFIFIVVTTSIDPFHYVLNEFLPHPYQRGIGKILATWIARVILTATCICEFIRFSVLLVIILTLNFLMMTACVKKMLIIPANKCVQLYLQLRACFALFLIFYRHFFFWFGICCWKFVPHALLLMAILAGTCTITNDIFLFTYAGTFRDISECIISSNRDRYFSRREYNLDKKCYYFKWWRAQCSMGIPCGSFFTFEKSSLMAYLRELANNQAIFLDISSVCFLFKSDFVGK